MQYEDLYIFRALDNVAVALEVKDRLRPICEPRSFRNSPWNLKSDNPEAFASSSSPHDHDHFLLLRYCTFGAEILSLTN